MTECDEIIIFIDNVSTKKTNTITTNVRNTALLSCHSIKVRLSCREQVCLSGLRFERYFSHHQAR